MPVTGYERRMGYGLGVFLLALGLILAFAVQDALEAVDLTMVGYILAGAGALVIVLTAAQTNRGRASTRRSSDHATADGSRDGRRAAYRTRTRRLPPV